jgi:c-di-GMP-binding flagellar brake protein YcgR
MERRRHRRVQIRLSASLEHRAADPSVSTPSVVVLDLSLGGAYCEVDHFVAPLTKVLLTVDVPLPGGDGQASESAVCRGVVVRTEPESAGHDRYRMGILFTEISRPDKEKLQRFLSRRADD